MASALGIIILVLGRHIIISSVLGPSRFWSAPTVSLHAGILVAGKHALDGPGLTYAGISIWWVPGLYGRYIGTSKQTQNMGNRARPTE